MKLFTVTQHKVERKVKSSLRLTFVAAVFFPTDDMFNYTLSLDFNWYISQSGCYKVPPNTNNTVESYIKVSLGCALQTLSGGVFNTIGRITTIQNTFNVLSYMLISFCLDCSLAKSRNWCFKNSTMFQFHPPVWGIEKNILNSNQCYLCSESSSP